jgi:hypothetical protein
LSRIGLSLMRDFFVAELDQRFSEQIADHVGGGIARGSVDMANLARRL